MWTVCPVLPGAYQTRLLRVTLLGPVFGRPFPPATSFLRFQAYSAAPLRAPSHPLCSFNCPDSLPPFLPFLPFPPLFPALRPPLPCGTSPFSFLFCPPFSSSPHLPSWFLFSFLPFSSLPCPFSSSLPSLSPNPDLQPRSRVPASRRCHTGGCRQRAAGTAPKARVTVPGGNLPRLCFPLGFSTTSTTFAHTLPQTILWLEICSV